MAALPSLDTQAKVVSDAAENFVEHYYESLNKRQPLAQYYASTSAHLTSASVKPDISINGRVLESVAAYEALLDAQGRNVRYEVASFDAQPVSPNYALGCPSALSLSDSDAATGRGKLAKSVKDGDRVSFAVQVNGTIRYGKPGDTTTAAATPAAGGTGNPTPGDGEPLETAFNEAWLLVPHWEALGRNAPRGLRRWVVVSQNFRAF
ncbi:nuclear transport factor 2 domain-containing protein [Xylaria flabelliformis]|nr:nuclear transport factor 2 domain-containing protein [Xylaria flabelliformis]